MIPKNLRRVIGVATAVCIFGANVPLEAQWHDNSKNLPGIKGFPVLTVVLGGAAVVASLVYRSHRKHALEHDPVQVPNVVNIGPDSTTAFKLENRGSSAVQLSEVVLKGYSLVDAPALPVIIRSNEDFELRVRATGPQHRGSVVLSILDGKRTRSRVVAIRPATN